jgi:hypothetical protein
MNLIQKHIITFKKTITHMQCEIWILQQNNHTLSEKLKCRKHHILELMSILEELE